MDPKKHLFRSRTDKIVAGVCGGFAKYFEVDAVFVRLAFVFILVLTGIFPGVIVYIVAVLIVPMEPEVILPNANPQAGESAPASNES